MPSSLRRPIAWLVLAICISETQPSCMRAPPEAEITRSGMRRSSASSAARVIARRRAAHAAADEAEVDPGDHERLAVEVARAVERPDLAPDFFWAAAIRSG